MNKIEYSVLKLLKKTMNNDIPIVVRNAPVDKTPCITINETGGFFIKRDLIQIPNNENIMEQVLQRKYHANLRVNVWCNTEEERGEINEKIDLCFSRALTDNYRCCSNYNENRSCSFLNETCQALTITNGRTSKEQCPYPRKNNYRSFFSSNNIVKHSFNLNQPFNLDELNTSQPILRSIFEINTDYYTYYSLGGNEFQEIRINEDLV